MQTSFPCPRILHQTWKTKEIPEECEEYVATWKLLHPEFEYKFYLDDDLREAVKSIVPRYLPIYDAMKRNIERVDFARYAILYGVGGVYADLDTVPLRSIEPWIEKRKVVLGREPLEHSRQIYGREIVLCNALMISPPKEKLWLELMEYIVENYNPSSDPVTNTGPMAMTLFLEKNPKLFSNSIITDPCVFFALTNGYTSKTQLGFTGVSRFCDLQNPTSPDKITYVVHAWHNEWTKVKGQKSIVSGYKKVRTAILDSEKKKKAESVPKEAVVKYGLKKDPCFWYVAVFGIVLFVLLMLRRK